MSYLTIEQKRQILREHYRKAYHFELNPSLPDNVIEDYYKKLQLLFQSERRHELKKKNLRLVEEEELEV